MKNFSYYLKVLIFVFVVVSVFTALDVLTHSLNDLFSVPEYYFPHKILFSTGMGFLIYLFTTRMKPFTRALLFSGIIAVVLQTGYFFRGYPKWFVFLFLGLHFIMLLPSAWLGFKISDRYKIIKN